MLDRAFAQVAGAVSTAFGGPYHDARLWWTLPAEKDDGGSIVVPGAPQHHDVRVQIDAATEAMRAEAGFVQTDMRFLVLGFGLRIPLNMKIMVEVPIGEWAGEWEMLSCARDSLGLGYEGRGRRIV